jgi:predicted nucleic acid-binding protein
MICFESGLKRLSRTDVFVVVDTMVFLKALGGISPSSEALDCIKKICNRIALSTEIRREYKCKATAEGMTSLILMRKIKELERVDKTKNIHQAELNNARTLIDSENLPLPTDTYDHKFFEVAIACRARYIITTDFGSLVLNPYDHNPVNIRIVEPTQYMNENCQNNIS